MRCTWLPPPRALDPRGRVLFVCEVCGSSVAVPAKFANLPVRRTCGANEPVKLWTNQQKDGPGSELKRLLLESGITPVKGCSCEQLRRLMDAWGPQECRGQMTEIVERLKRNSEKLWWGEKLSAAAKLIQEPWWNPLRPYESLVEEALRRWEAKAA